MLGPMPARRALLLRAGAGRLRSLCRSIDGARSPHAGPERCAPCQRPRHTIELLDRATPGTIRTGGRRGARRRRRWRRRAPRRARRRTMGQPPMGRRRPPCRPPSPPPRASRPRHASRTPAPAAPARPRGSALGTTRRLTRQRGRRARLMLAARLPEDSATMRRPHPPMHCRRNFMRCQGCSLSKPWGRAQAF